jgi:hypothetical protein
VEAVVIVTVVGCLGFPIATVVISQAADPTASFRNVRHVLTLPGIGSRLHRAEIVVAVVPVVAVGVQLSAAGHRDPLATPVDAQIFRARITIEAIQRRQAATGGIGELALVSVGIAGALLAPIFGNIRLEGLEVAGEIRGAARDNPVVDAKAFLAHVQGTGVPIVAVAVNRAIELDVDALVIHAPVSGIRVQIVAFSTSP